MLNEIIVSMVSGLAINLITYLSGKLHISKTHVSVGLCLFIGLLMYLGQTFIQQYPAQWDKILGIAMGSYGFSQMLYSTYNKLSENDKKH